MSKQHNILDGYEQKSSNCKLLKKHRHAQKSKRSNKKNVIRENMLVLSSKSIKWTVL